jgi:hypothetical protein
VIAHKSKKRFTGTPPPVLFYISYYLSLEGAIIEVLPESNSAVIRLPVHGILFDVISLQSERSKRGFQHEIEFLRHLSIMSAILRNYFVMAVDGIGSRDTEK